MRRPAIVLAIAAALATALCAGCSSGSGGVTRGQGIAAPAARGASAGSAPRVAARTPSPPTRLPASTHPQAPDSCAHNALAQRVIVDISAQHLWLCARGHTVFQSAVTTGAVALAYDSTPLGSYVVQDRSRDTTLTLADGASYRVHYWIPFDAPLFGFHDATWQRIPFGSPAYRTQGSHGCVHLPLAAMSYLYRWVQVGAAVTIRT